ncbi:MAG: protein-glutamine gamma-glutamyltransferase [Solirubrobacteraceae bacterium]|nr:protein-glutamine gamma-glutamyltransferase [Solirubrobacteraceae bacterium]
MSATASRPPALAPRASRPSGPSSPSDPSPPARRSTALLPAHVARLSAFVALAGFGALQWAQMVRPVATDALLGCVLAATVAGALLCAVARREPRARVRVAATLVAAFALLLVALAAAGAPLRFLGPRGWDDLAGGIGQGVGAVSTVRTPYAGLDEWTRLVIVLGGCALAGLAAVLAFAPRRGGAFGAPTAAAVALGALYTVPVMQHDIRLPYLAGLLFALLLAAFLWLERVEQRSVGPAAALVAVAALGGYVVAPRLDGDRALLDYEALAQSLSAAPTTQYSWNHDYGPLDWPRDGREVLRIRAPHRAYWKAVNLAAFDGVRWVQDTGQATYPLEAAVFERAWVQRIRVTLRALRTSQFVAAGSTLDILDRPRTPASNSPGVYESAGDPLHRGHAYRAIVYTPRPSAAQLRRAGSAYGDMPREYGVVRLPQDTAGPAAGAGLRARGGGPDIVFPWWSERGAPVIVGAPGAAARAANDASPYGPVYALARRLRAGAATPFAYVRAIERYLAGSAFRYTETPRRSRAPLADFLLRDRAGYCQQFSGAMALLLRMGGVPARVASGFSPGVLDTERDEYVVRDVDAHSWVEFFAPGVGWVTRDPTPAASPARAQTADLVAGGEDRSVTFAGSERALGRRPDGGSASVPAAPSRDPGPSALAVVGVVLAVLAAGAGVLALFVRRRRRGTAGAAADADLAELHRALRRTGRPAPPQLTLDALALRLDGTPAQAYVRTLARARYGYGDRPPSRAERAALRDELAAALGARGRLRAWWALPPLRPVRPVRRVRPRARRPAR